MKDLGRFNALMLCEEAKNGKVLWTKARAKETPRTFSILRCDAMCDVILFHAEEFPSILT